MFSLLKYNFVYLDLLLVALYIQYGYASGASSLESLCEKTSAQVSFYLVGNKSLAHLKHSDRCALKLLIDSLQRNMMITDIPEDADFYIYPLSDEKGMSAAFAESINYDRDLHRTVFGVNVQDGGWFYKSANVEYRTLFYENLRNATLLSYYGLKTGRKSICFKQEYVCEGNFRKGRDIVIPGPNSCGDDLEAYQERIYRPGIFLNNRTTLLYFAGGIKAKTSPLARYGGAASFRYRFLSFCKKRRRLCQNVELRSKAGSLREDLAFLRSSIFCLNAPGKYGGYAVRLTRLILNGCIPVNVLDAETPFQDYLPYKNFSLTYPAHFSIHKILAELRSKSEKEISELQNGLRENYKYFSWSGHAISALVGSLLMQRCS